MNQTGEFEGFMRSYQDMVYATAVRLLGNEAEAEDVAQEVFLRAYDRFNDLKDSPAVGGWLKTVTRNLCLNHLFRYQARWKFFSDFLSSYEDESESVEWAGKEDVEKDFETEERRQLLDQALRELPTAQRVPLVLFHVEDLSYEQIAQELRVSVSKVKTDMFRGRQALKKILVPQLS